MLVVIKMIIIAKVYHYSLLNAYLQVGIDGISSRTCGRREAAFLQGEPLTTHYPSNLHHFNDTVIIAHLVNNTTIHRRRNSQKDLIHIKRKRRRMIVMNFKL